MIRFEILDIDKRPFLPNPFWQVFVPRIVNGLHLYADTDEPGDVCDDWWMCEGRARYGTWLVVIGGPPGAGATHCPWCGRPLEEV
jgi:hypothetical protein